MFIKCNDELLAIQIISLLFAKLHTYDNIVIVMSVVRCCSKLLIVKPILVCVS